MIVAVVGSRDWPEIPRVQRFVTALAVKYPEVVVVSGGARGVDRAAEETADALGLPFVSFRPYQYENMGARREYSIETISERVSADLIGGYRINAPYFRTYAQAALHRNGWIVELADRVVAFNAGSCGTADTLERARKAGKPTTIYGTTAEAAFLLDLERTFNARVLTERELRPLAGVHATGGGTQWDESRNTSRNRITRLHNSP